MALTQGSTVLWSDLTNIYSSLNTARTKFGFSTASPSGGAGTPAYASQVSTLNSLVTEMKSNRFLSNLSVGITPPAKGDLLRANFLSDLNLDITEINDVCAFDSSNFTFSGNFGFNSSDFSFSGNFGFHSSDFSFSANFSFHSGNFSFSGNRSFHSGNFSFSGNRSFNSGDFSFSGNRGFNSGDFSFSGNRSFNSGNFSWRSNSNFGTFSWRGSSFNTGNFQWTSCPSNFRSHKSTSSW